MMKALLIFPLLAAILAASPPTAEPCPLFATRIAATLRLAAEERPVHVTFDTRTVGVAVPDWLKAQYPVELTIVLQHQFERLRVKDDGFEVTLWFKGRDARIAVPFAAVTELIDNRVKKCSDP